MSDYKITDDGDPRRYYSQIPHIIDDADLSVYAFRLYIKLKRTAGENGKCFKSTRTLADECNMSTASVSRAKAELVEAGLIRIEEKPGEQGRRPLHEIYIIDVWAENMATYSQKREQVTTGNLQDTDSNKQVTDMRHKNNPVKKNPSKNKGNNNGWQPTNGSATVERVYRDVTGYFVIPQTKDKNELEYTIEAFIAHKGGPDGAVEYLKPFWNAWTKEFGYRGSNHNWCLQWAVEGKIPSKPAGKSSNSAEEIDSWLQP